MAAREPVADNSTPPSILTATGIQAGHGRRPVVFDVSLSIAPGEVVALFGHNGAGKTTTLCSLFGIKKLTSGKVEFRGEDITGSSAARNVRRGLSYIPAEEFVFGELSVIDNLKLGTTQSSSNTPVAERLDRVYELFPILADRRAQIASTMSGGQQRMLSIGISLMAEPRMMLLDEPSLGLSPALVEEMMAAILKLSREQSLSVLLVEQNVLRTLPVVDRAYFMRSGRIILSESSEELRTRDSFWELF